jgi:hypothetical protein
MRIFMIMMTLDVIWIIVSLFFDYSVLFNSRICEDKSIVMSVSV